MQLDAAGQRVDGQAVGGDKPGCLLAHRLLTAEQRPDPRHQLLHRERFGEVIIGPGFKAQNALGFAAAGADDNHRQVVVALADRPAEGQSVNVGQHQVEDHRIPVGLPEQVQRLFPVCLVGDHITFIF